MTDLDEYLRAKEPDKRERAANWSAAIGLQKVDGLTPSQYLVETARRNIVRANYTNIPKGVHPTTMYLERFFRNAILGESNNMQSRFLLVGTPDEPATLVPQRREQAGEQVKEQARAAFPLGVKRLIRIFSGEMSVVELMAALKLGGRRNFLEKYLTPAIENGLVEMTQPDSPRSPTQKYRLTAKGLAAKGCGA